VQRKNREETEQVQEGERMQGGGWTQENLLQKGQVPQKQDDEEEKHPEEEVNNIV